MTSPSKRSPRAWVSAQSPPLARPSLPEGWGPYRDRSPDGARLMTLTRARMRKPILYAGRGAPESVGRLPATGASYEARWTGYTGVIIALRSRCRPNDSPTHDQGNRMTSADRPAAA